MKRSALHRWIPFRLAALVAPLIAAWPQKAQAAVITWDAGAGATSQSWQTATNWSTDVLPGSGDVASFAAAGTPTSNQIGSAANVSIQALQIQSTRTLDLTIGNSSTAANFTMTLGGTTIGAFANTVLSYERSGGSLNINNTSAGGSGTGRTFNVILNNATNNVFQVATGGTVNMNTIIQQGAAGYKLTKEGGGVLVLAAANTFSGAVTVNGGATNTSTLRVQNATGLGTGTVVTLNNGTLNGGSGTTLDIRNTITVAAGKTLTMNSNATGDLRSTLLNGANNNTWNSNIVAAGTGLVQINAAAGTNFTIGGGITSTGGAGTGTLFTRGGGTVIYNGVINLGTDRLFNKTDGGTALINSVGNAWLRSQVSDGQIQIGATNALPNVEFSFGQNSGTNGRLELNGFDQTVARLNTWGGNTAHTPGASTGTNHILRNSNLITAATLTFSTPASATDTLTNVNVFGSAFGLGTLNLVSNGTGRTEFNGGFAGANSWTVNAGTLAFTGNATRLLPGTVTGAAAATVEKAGTGSLISQSAWNHAGTTNVVGGTLVVSAGTAGAVNISDGAGLSAGLNGGVFSPSALTFGAAGSTVFAPMLGAPSTTAPVQPATLTTGGTSVTVAPMAPAFSMGSYALIDYGSITGNGFAGFTLAPTGSYPHMTATLVDNATDGRVDLNVTAVDSLVWTGAVNGTWDTNTTQNFKLASDNSSAAFYTSDAVLFDDMGANKTIAGSSVLAGNLSFNNSTGNDYSIANPVSGPGSISKSNTGSVTLSGTNSYSGATNVSNGTLVLSGANALGGAVSVTGGTLRIGNSEALRGASTITVSDGGTFEANGTAVGNRYPELIVSGAGVGGNGAVVNNGAPIVNNSHYNRYTLTGDTTWGGSARYDVTGNQTFNAGAFTLTKVGAGELWFNPAAGSTLENVIVNGGAFGSQGANPLSTTATVTVNNGGTHQIFSSVAQQHKVVLNDGGTLRSTNGTPTINGTVTLNGTTAGRNIQGTSGTTLNIAGKLTGTGGFTVNDTGTVQLQNATNDYQGDTVIAAGTLNFSGTGNVPATTNLIVNGGTFATGNIARTVGSLSGTGGTINGGNTFTSDQSATTSWAGVLSGTTLAMNGSGSLTLAGSTDNGSGMAVASNGTLVLAKTGDYAVHTVGSGNLGLTINNGATVQIGGSLTAVTGGSASNNPPADITPATPPANYVDQIFNFTEVLVNTGGTLDLNGRIEAIDGLGGGGTVTNSAGATTGRLYVGYNNSASTTPGFLGNTSTFSGVIQNGDGTTELTKIGTGTLVLGGANTYTGATTINAGTLTVAASGSLGNTAVAINSGGAFAPSGNVGAGGSVTLNAGGTLNVGGNTSGVTANTISAGSLTLGGGTVNIDFTGTAADRVNTSVSNGLTMNGANTVNVLLGSSGWVSGTYPVYTYAGALQGAGTAALNLATPFGHNTVSFVDDAAGTVNLQVTAVDNKWVGGSGSSWDINTTDNWSAADQKFLNGDNVVFDNTATTFAPHIAATVTPAATIFNSGTYTLSGTAGIAGTGQLVKNGGDTVTLLNPNTYTGNTTVNGGALVANYNTGAAVTVLAAGSTVNVAGGAIFRAIANDSGFTLANPLTGSGTVELNAHAAAGGVVPHAITLSGVGSGFSGTLRLLAPVTGTYRVAPGSPASLGTAAVEVQSGAQLYPAAGTYNHNASISGTGYADANGNIGALRLEGVTWAGNIAVDAGGARIGAHSGTGIVSGSISGGNLSVNATNYNTNSYTMVFTGANSYGATTIGGAATGGTGSNSMRLNIGNGGTTGTLGAGNVIINGDGMNGVLGFDRSDGYTLAAGQTITSAGSTLARTFIDIETQGAGFDNNGNTINLGTPAAGGNFRVGVNRANALATINATLSGGNIQIGAGAAGTAATLTLAAGANVSMANVAMGLAATGATLNIQPGATISTTGNFFLGEQSGFQATVNQTGGASSVGSHVRVGHWPNNTSVYGISGGTLAITANPAAINPSTAGGTEQNGGIYLGIDGTGVMNQSGTSTVTTDWVVLDNRGNSGPGVNQPDGVDRYNLSGGTLELRGQFGITNRNATTEFNFSGGTIKNVGAGVNAVISGAGSFVIGTGGTGTPTFDTNGATNQFTVSRSMSGAGTLVKAGAGTLNLTVDNTYSGGTRVDGGLVKLTGSNAGLSVVGGGTLTINAGATVEANSHNTLGQGTGAALSPLVIDGGSFLADQYNHLNSLTMTAGTLGVRSGVTQVDGMDLRTRNSTLPAVTTLASPATAIISSKLTLRDDTTFTVARGTATPDLLVSGVITGPATLTKAGPGTMTLTAINSYTGPTVIRGGTLHLEAGSSIATSSLFTVQSGGTLSGSGATGPVAFDDGATLSPGSSPGILTTGSVSTSPTTNVIMEIGGLTPGTHHDQISTTGAVTLNGGALVVSLINSFMPNINDPFDIWLNDAGEGIGGTPGTFTGLAEGAQINIPETSGGPGNGLDSDYWQISYFGGDGNDIRLTYVPEPSSAVLAAGAALLALGRRRRKIS